MFCKFSFSPFEHHSLIPILLMRHCTYTFMTLIPIFKQYLPHFPQKYLLKFNILIFLLSGRSRISRRGRGPRRGAWTPKAVTFRKFCMSKRKNLDPWGACAGHAPRSANASCNTPSNWSETPGVRIRGNTVPSLLVTTCYT